jgi:hypothetical protein
MAKRSRLFDDDTFEVRGYRFRVRFPPDEDHGAPWEDYDGHGIVSDWTTRSKRAGERVLSEDHNSKRYYDVAASIKIAKKDQWGPIHCAICDKSDHGPYDQQYGPHAKDHNFTAEPAGITAARAVERDYEFLRGWCNDEWHYCGVVVTLIEEDDEDSEEEESVWGIEDNADEYLTATAYELADEILSRIEVEDPDVVLSEN